MNKLEDLAQPFSILDQVPVGMCVVREDYTVLFWNKRIEDWTQICREDIVGNDLAFFFPPFDEPAYRSRLEGVFRGGPPAIFSAQLYGNLFPSPLPNGEFRIQHTTVTHTFGTDNDEHYCLFAVEDVTELSRRNREAGQMRDKSLDEAKRGKETEEKLREANLKIIDQQNRVVEEERLRVLLQAAEVSVHDLNQPLTALLGRIELMGMSRDDPKTVWHHLSAVEEAGQRIAEIAKNIQLIHHKAPPSFSEKTSNLTIVEQVNILVVEDSHEDFDAMNKILKEDPHINLFRADCIASAFGQLENTRFDMIFLDYALPDGNGLEFLQKMVARHMAIPVVVVSWLEDSMTASQIIQAGAYDFLSKSKIGVGALSRIIINTLEKSHLKKDILKVQRRLAEMSTMDGLTGLFNRRYFNERLTSETLRAERYNTGLVLCLIDVDRFKEINDTYGHSAGDFALAEMGRALNEHFRETDVKCRYGGEEFAAIVPHALCENAHAVAERFRKSIEKREFLHDSNKFHITVSVGIASIKALAAPSPEALIQAADTALYQAKKAGRNRVVVFEQ